MNLGDFLSKLETEVGLVFRVEGGPPSVDDIELLWTDASEVEIGLVETHREFLKRTLHWSDEKIDSVYEGIYTDRADDHWLVTLTDGDAYECEGVVPEEAPA